MSTTHRQALERIEALAASDAENARAVLVMIGTLARKALAGVPAVPDDRPELTARQAEILGFIESHHTDHGYAPSVREIGKRLGIASPNGVRQHLVVLAKKGYVRWHDGKNRTLVVVGGGR